MKFGCLLFFVLLIEMASSFFLNLGYGNTGYGYSGYSGYGGYGITYQLYTKLNPVNGQPLTYGNLNSVGLSNFRNNNPTRFIIHGFGQNGRSAINRDLKNGYLSRGDFNVIVVDWNSVSSPYYQYARYRVPTTGVAVGKFIEFLNPNYETLHVVGYDLGAHVAGIAGKNTLRGKVNRIVGLDPSLPLFNEYASGGRLNAGDATFVEVFHSNGGQLGIFQPIGDIDYYINNGRSQPECAGGNNDCSHLRSVATFSRLLNRQNNFVVIPCETINDVATGCSLDPVEILIEEASPSGIYQINTVSAEAINNEVESFSR